MALETEFQEFPKMGRWSREVIVSEKIDGTNAQIYIDDTEAMFAGSRTRWITPEADNYGFARWVQENRAELLKLGPGRHFGEWWGKGVQRGYDLKEKRFSLFNIGRWCEAGKEPKVIPTLDPRTNKVQEIAPSCVSLVPELWRGNMDDLNVPELIETLRTKGSSASPGFMKPEGIVIFHVASNMGFKKTLDKDESPKSLVK